MLAHQKPKFVVMMLGLNDRQHDQGAGPGGTGEAGAARQSGERPLHANSTSRQRSPHPTAAAAPDAAGARQHQRTFEFRSDSWSETYIRRIDDTIAALKSKGVPVFWVGLPPVAAAAMPPPTAVISTISIAAAPTRRASSMSTSGTASSTRTAGSPDGARLRRPDAAAALRRRRVFHPGRRAQARALRRARNRSLADRTPVALAVPADEPKAAARWRATSLLPRRAGKARIQGAAARRPGGAVDPEAADDSGRTSGGGKRASVCGRRCSRRRRSWSRASRCRRRPAAPTISPGRAARGAGRRRPRGRHHRSPMTPMVAERPLAGAAGGSPRRSGRGQAAAAKQAAQQQAAQTDARCDVPDAIPAEHLRRRRTRQLFPFLFGGGR